MSLAKQEPKVVRKMMMRPALPVGDGNYPMGGARHIEGTIRRAPLHIGGDGGVGRDICPVGAASVIAVIIRGTGGIRRGGGGAGGGLCPVAGASIIIVTIREEAIDEGGREKTSTTDSDCKTWPECRGR